MGRSGKLRIGLVAFAGGALALATMPASANSTGYFTLQSLSTQSWTTTGEAATTTYQGFISCTWNSGSGAFAGNCATGAGNEPIAGSFSRVGTLLEMTGTIGPGPITGSFHGVCSATAVTRPPTLYYDQHCHFTVS